MRFIEKDTQMPGFIPFPRFMLSVDISATAKIVYAKLYHRALLSQRKEWFDEEGKVFIIYPVRELAKDLRCTERTVTRALTELEKLDFINRRQLAKGSFNAIYVKSVWTDLFEGANDEEIKWMLS